MKPIKKGVYSLRQIFKELQLDDSPSLGLTFNGLACCIQTSHYLNEDLLRVDGWANISFTYLYTTHEWIPAFSVFEDDRHKLLSLLDIEPMRDSDGDVIENELWVTPKAFPRQQYYMLLNGETK